MKFVLASHNRGKLQEMQTILSHLGVEVVLQSDLGLNLEPEETGTTFLENAAIKARAVAQASGLPAIADDSGLCVDWLNGAPGIYSARYGGVGSDQARYQLLLQNLRGATNRAAHFHTAVVCCFPDGRQLSAQGDCYGTIAFAPMGEGGFGYDPVFIPDEIPAADGSLVPNTERLTLAELSEEDKNAISHRGKALRAMAAHLNEK